MDEFPSNSNNAKKEGPEVTQIISGGVSQRKRPLGSRFRETFFSSADSKSVFGFVLTDIVVPAVQNLVADAIRETTERAIFGDRRTPRSGGVRYASSTGGMSRTNYSGYSSPPPWRANQPAQTREISPRARQSHNFDEILLDNRGDAEQVRDTLEEIVSQYGQASVADMYALVGITAQYTDQNHGWTDLTNIRVRSVSGGRYLIELPPTTPLPRN